MQKRHIWNSLLAEIDRDEILVLTGSRQVGKTTTLHWLLAQIPSANKQYLDLENIQNRQLFAVTDYDNVIRELQNLGLDSSQRMYIAVDEIQLVPELPSIIKYLYDHYPIKFILSGSSSYYLKNLFSESMAGRKIIYELFPLSFGEFLQFKGENYVLPKFDETIEFSPFAYAKLHVLYEEYIEYGGLPKVVLTQNLAAKKRLLQMIFSSYINIDVKSMSDFKSEKDFVRLVELLAARIGNKVNISALANILGIHRNTVESYVTFMEQTYLIRLIKPYSQSSDVQVRSAPKLYFVDTGIANGNYDLSGGAKLENTVSHQLFLQADLTAFGRKLTYFADKHSEIDFILNERVALEIKESPIQKDLDTLARNAAKIGREHYRLIGKNQSASFNEFIWGGMIA